MARKQTKILFLILILFVFLIKAAQLLNFNYFLQFIT